MSHADLSGANLSAAVFSNTKLHAARREGGIFLGATGSTIDTDQDRAIGELYSTRAVTLDGETNEGR
jgi:uncharacterized protein YjbI with pentapeptide repeats